MKHTMHLPKDQRSNVIAEEVSRKFDKAAEAVCQALGNRTYLLGSEFSGADIVIGYCCNWAAYTSQISAHPRLIEYHDLLKRRPAYQKVFGG